MKIIKIGGSKIKNKFELNNLIQILKKAKNSHFFVISAFGKTTSLLNKALIYSSNKDLNFKQILNQIYNFHLNLFSDENFCSNKIIYNEFNNYLINTINKLEHILLSVYKLSNYSLKVKDKILSFGEVIALDTLNFYLTSLDILNIQYLNATEFIITDENYGNANILYDKSKYKLDILLSQTSTKNLFITNGFIGMSENGNITTMGLESSNLTAVIIANILNSKKITLITDTEGILDADPRFFDNNITLKQINFLDAKILSELGIKLLYNKMIELALNNNINITYKSINDLNDNNITSINFKSPPLYQSIYIVDVKYIKLNNIELEDNLFLKNNLNRSTYCINNSYYTNLNVNFKIFKPIIKISIFNFKIKNLFIIRDKYSEYIDNLIIESKINTLHIFLDKNNIKSLNDTEEEYKQFETIFYNDIKLYL